MCPQSASPVTDAGTPAAVSQSCQVSRASPCVGFSSPQITPSVSAGADGDGEAETELLGDCDALGLCVGLVDEDGLVLALWLGEDELLGLVDADGDTLALGERLGLALPLGLVEALGDCDGLESVTQTCTSFDAALSPSPFPARTTRYQTPDSVRKSASSASRASGSLMMKSSVYVPGDVPNRIRQ